MKHLKSTLGDIRDLVERRITVRDIAESLVSFDMSADSADVKQTMQERDFDLVGIRDKGSIVGYVLRQDMKSGPLSEHVRRFSKPDEIIAEMSPLARALELISSGDRAFVSILGQVGGIATRGDLHKAPIRMWLFSLISLAEMQLLRLLKSFTTESDWTAALKKARHEQAEKLLRDRRKKNEALDLADCFQFCDKRTILMKHESLWKKLGFESRRDGESFLKNLEDLRNEIAHSQDFLPRDLSKLATLVKRTERFLEAAEAL